MPYLKNQSEDCLYLNIFAPLQSKYNLRKVTVKFKSMIYVRYLS